MTTALTGKERRFLRALGHDLDPVVQVGKLGLTEGVAAATDVALDTHELIKLKIGTECPEPVADIAEALAPQVQAELVQVLGRTILLFRMSAKNPKVPLPGRKMTKPSRSQAKSKPKRRPPRGRSSDGAAPRERGAPGSAAGRGAPGRGASGRGAPARGAPARGPSHRGAAGRGAAEHDDSPDRRPAAGRPASTSRKTPR
ncbi:MAG: ribosome assembly RNA-binding protein YhbY [Myxococcales bacterium]|nr:ribosome assembly RNA-binding protein YhbY [Myxococcales bacterium]